jgi:uncharacterized membrane protein YdjX (TVP38/TMEM64 family)
MSVSNDPQARAGALRRGVPVPQRRQAGSARQQDQAVPFTAGPTGPAARRALEPLAGAVGPARREIGGSIAAFLRAPFWTTVIVIFSPIPDSAVRVLAPLSRYPLPKFLGAIALGRFPRLLLIAGSGALPKIPLSVPLLGSVVLVAAGVAWRRLTRVT